MRHLLVICVLISALLSVASVSAQPPHQCGLTFSFSVVYPKVDNMGYAPRPMPGSETVFNCIAARDPDFASRRFPSSWEALNYWFILYSQELGVSLQPLPAPIG